MTVIFAVSVQVVVPSFMVAVAVMVEVPLEIPVAPDVKPLAGVLSVAGLAVTWPLFEEKSTLEIVPFVGVTDAVRTDAAPTATEEGMDVRLRMHDGIAVTVTVEVPVHVWPPLIVAVAVMVEVPAETAVAMVV